MVPYIYKNHKIIPKIFLYNYIMIKKFAVYFIVYLLYLGLLANLFLVRKIHKKVYAPIEIKQARSLLPLRVVAELQPINGVFFHGSRHRKQIALTFDADMTQDMKNRLASGQVKSWYNHQVIDILDQTHTKATLFLTGMWIETYPSEAKILASDPLFELGNHSYSHGSFYGKCFGLKPILSIDAAGEIEKTQKLLFDITGTTNHLFRFPGGCYDTTILKAASKLGLDVIQWDVVSGDAFGKNTKIIEQNVLGKVQNGSIIVFHLHGGPNAPHTADALPYLISKLRAEGYEFVKVTDLLI